MIKKVVFLLALLLTTNLALSVAPISISSCEDLQSIQDSPSRSYYLTNDIDCINYSSPPYFQPIGSTSDPFTGTLDCKNFEIKNLKIVQESDQPKGLFSQISSSAEISNCRIEGEFEFSSTSSPQNSGGLVGINEGTISNCLIEVEFSSENEEHVGALVGYNKGNIGFSGSIGEINLISSTDYTGGLVGINEGTINKSFSEVKIEGTGDTVGGLVGYGSSGSSIKQSLAYGSINGDGTINTAGGLVGYNKGSISESYSRGNVQVSGDNAGGLIGNANSGNLEDSYSTGLVSSSTSSGGLAAILGSLVETGSYWNNESSGKSTSPIGDPLTTYQSKQQSSYSGWDFSNVWDISSSENSGYPFLSWQTECNGICNEGFSGFSDPDCLSYGCCGDGTCSSYETEQSCPEDCQCGNGILDVNEECDEGSSNTNDPCDPGTSSCTYCTKECESRTISLETAYWTDLNGELITHANLGDTVGMIIWDTGLTIGEEVTFEIYELDEGWLNPSEEICTGEDAIIGTVYESTPNAAIALWTITMEDLLMAGDEYEDFRFKANGIEQNGSLDVSDSVSTASDFKVTLTSPTGGSYIYLNDELNITFNAEDPTDTIQGKITIEDEETLFSNGEYIINHTFQNQGTVPITITANNSRGETINLMENIIVFGNPGTYIAACISEPKDTTRIQENEIKFSAECTRAYQYDGATISTIPLEDISFYWQFSDGTTNPYISGSEKKAYEFYKVFPSNGINWAKLEIEV